MSIRNATRVCFAGLIAGWCLIFVFAGCGDEGPSITINGDENGGGQALCDDGIQNGGETDVDCGGARCEPCDQGRSCERSNDCTTGLCDRGTCVDQQCVGVDCLAGQSCYRGECYAGCQSQQACPDAEERCASGACVPLDCSGVACANDETCYEGACYPTCDGAADCGVGDTQCLDSACVTPRCDDGIQSGEETDIDCGGTVCGACDEGQRCLNNGDCLQEIGEWSECEFEAGNQCASAGVQTREIYELECSEANICAGQVEVETRDCERETDGLSCGDEQIISQGQCEPADLPVQCSAGGTRLVEKVTPLCSSGQCQEQLSTESESCELNTTGLECSPAASCAASAQCSPGGACEITAVESGSCLIDGVCYDEGDENPARSCEQCDPSYSSGQWSQALCGTTFSQTRTMEVAIPDNSWSGVLDTIEIESCEEIVEISLSVDITHPDRGDLAVGFSAPGRDTHSYLHYLSGDGNQDLVTTWPNDLDYDETGIRGGSEFDNYIGTDGSGEWEIKVVDGWPGLTGTFHSWALEISCL